jgi:hypothetical protein
VKFLLLKRLSFATFDSVNRISSIFLISIFCIYSFTFKSHYCYHYDGTRFHGDCEAYKQKTETNLNKSTAFLYEQKYVCYNAQLNKQYQRQNCNYKSFNDFVFTLASQSEFQTIINPSKKKRIALFFCRGGPPLIERLLRSPPYFIVNLRGKVFFA